jgi:hypothetical protein
MTTTDKLINVERVACEVCLKELPKSEATVSEVTDYVVYFCGLDCHEKWKSQRAKLDDQA